MGTFHSSGILAPPYILRTVQEIRGSSNVLLCFGCDDRHHDETSIETHDSDVVQLLDGWLAVRAADYRLSRSVVDLKSSTAVV